MRVAIFIGVLLHYALAYSLIGLASPIERLDAPPEPAVSLPQRVVQSPPPPSRQPRRPSPKSIVPVLALMNLRTAGTTDIHPSPADRSAMHSDGITRGVGIYKLCVSELGSINSVATLKSMRYADFDARIVAAIRGWHFKPYVVDGDAYAVCAAVTFVYSTR